ncbi:MAG TPA: hypothetical protein VK464_22030 [Symbiobacteriaceae bacterium]|jgi:hypothetical protein|nr:hypothetical protein [Symbiobacteriaceae bacterium]
MAKTIVAEQTSTETLSISSTLIYWPESVRNNPRREMDLPRLTVPMFGPVSSAYVYDEDDAYGTAD